MRFFRLDASLRFDGSVTRTLADAVEQEDAHAAATAHGIEIARRLRPAS
jgi:hypothetical protein